ncbi:hypothetical protein HAX54_018188 [Datura stramonium]|uniref:Uncharacterized protein n=1 Tax=Datura stramonium TaxID=4076 RepID=A0ABS8UNZ6_DATST|nr:hypothetical protein [Datura stramonium]
MSDHIPNWLLPEILCTLLVESLLRFRCVSKQCVTLPKPPPHDQRMFWLVFGFDPKNRDFKVVRIAYLGGLNGGCMEAERCYWVHKKWRIFVAQYPGSLLAYDPERREFKDLDIHGWRESFFLRKYVESLVLLDGSNGAKADPSIASESEEATEL